MQVYANPIWSWPFTALFAAILVMVSVWTYPPNTPKRSLLLGIRLAALFVALFCAFRPSLVFIKKQKQTSVLAILVDKSKSMTLNDMWADQSRWQVVRRLLEDAKPALTTLEETVQVRRFEFDRELREGVQDKEPAGDQTALGKALQTAQQRLAGERLAGFILMSDGASTTGVSPATVARVLAAQKAPVFAFGFGQETASDQARDVAFKNLSANPVVFAKNKMTVRGDLAIAGFSSQSIPVRLLFNGVETAKGVAKPAADGKSATIELTAIPQTAGDLKITLEADKLPGELLPNNNSISTYVTVLAGGIGVLQIEGKYRYWEPKFVRWALDQSPDIDLSQLFLLDNSGKRAALPPDLFTPGRFDVVLMGDIAASQFQPDELRALQKLVTESGAGFLMMGGYESFGPGNWGSSILAELLPVDVRPGDGQLKQPLKMIPTPAGLRHFILRLGATNETTLAIWNSLRPLDGGNVWSRLKPGAVLLAATPEGIPLMAAQEIGAGRSLALAADTTWRWRKGKEGTSAHARFWRQLILWLAKKEESSETKVRLKLESRRIASGQSLPIEVRVEKGDGQANTTADVAVIVETPDGKELPVKLAPQGGKYVGSFFDTDKPGDYTVRVSATEGGAILGSARAKFVVYDEDTELLQLAADHETLRMLAEKTGGEYHTPEQFEKFITSLSQRDLNLEITKPIYETLWDRWQTLALFIALVTCEWILRKRNGLA